MWFDELHLVDTETGTAKRCALSIRAGRIEGIAARAPAGSKPTSLGGAFVLPGLIACHTHLQAHYPYTARDPNEPAVATYARASAQAVRTLKAGITTVRCLHEQHAVDIALRDDIAAGRAVGPRIFAAGRGLTITGGHADGLGARVVDGAEGFHAGGLAELEAGANHLKVYASGGLARAGESLDAPEMSIGEMQGAVRAAREYGTYVAAHAASSASVKLGLMAGIRSFEHAYRLDAETAGLMAAAGAFLTPTLVVTHVPEWKRAHGFDEASIERSSAAGPEHLRSIGRAIAAGVTIVCGTDFPPGEMEDGVPLMVHELELLVVAGLTPAQALRAATTNAARLVGAPELGKLVEGGPADLIVVERDPTADVTALRSITLVMQAGNVVRSA